MYNFKCFNLQSYAFSMIVVTAIPISVPGNGS